APIVGTLTHNTYDLTGVVSFSNPPNHGELIVTNGNYNFRYKAPFPAGSVNYSIKGLKSNSGNYTVTAYFTDAPSCKTTATYVALAAGPTDPVTDCITSFQPQDGSWYVVSCWVREEPFNPFIHSFNQADVQ